MDKVVFVNCAITNCDFGYATLRNIQSQNSSIQGYYEEHLVPLISYNDPNIPVLDIKAGLKKVKRGDRPNPHSV